MNRTALFKLTANSFLLHSRNPFLSSIIHFSSRSNDGSKLQKVANLDDALNLFDQMSQRQSFPSVIKFNQLLGVVTKMKHFSHSLDLFKRMCALRVPVDDYTMNIAINCCCHLSCTNEGFAVFGFFLKRGIRPDAWTFSTLLNGLVREDRILEAEIFFKKLIKDKMCEPNVVMYSTMIKGLCKIGNNVIAIQLLRLMQEREQQQSGFFVGRMNQKVANSILLHSRNPFLSSIIHFSSRSNDGSKLQKVANLDHALNLFDQMSQRQPFPSVIKFNQLLSVVTKMKHFSHSLDMFKRMCALRVPVDDYTMNITINCCCQLSCTNEGFAVFGFFLKRGIPPDAWTFNTLLNGLVREDRILEAEIFFKKLIKDKMCEPNVVMYSTMIKGLCKIGNNVIAIQLLRLMVERGCKPNVVTYNTIIDSLCKDNMIDDAFKLFKEMVFKKGISPNVITYNCLIDGLCNLGRRDEASKMLQEMLDVGISPNVRTFTILVDAFCKDGKVEEAENVIDIMLERGIVPDIVTYSSVIDGYCLRGEMTKAKKTFDSLALRGLVPNIVTYSSLLNGYCKSSKIDEAMYMFHEIAKKGLEPNVVTYSTMIQGLFAVRRCSDARKLFDEMLAKCQLPNECTYQILIEGLCYNHQVEEALSMFQLSRDSKLKSNIIVYTILIDGARKCGKPDIAKFLFQELTHKGLQPNVRTYTVMINLFCEKGQLSDAKQLFLEMAESGCPPNNVAYRNLLQGYLRNKHYDDVEMLLHEMDERHYTLDVSTLSLFLHQIASGLLDATLLELIGKLVPNELMENVIIGEEMKSVLTKCRK
ncbi:tetratricopeptide-like helical domain-containing protein [Artemisia annua]|uniref:Tetratricopeptide-like helical domain-containing protein n=1 Tax=Artemisia annua TaxID=35608 RepID=A0A2U1MFK6_ARTAN|nr:tetratricopeptide-like helical domain-containing protein [Artemisia annua]